MEHLSPLHTQGSITNVVLQAYVAILVGLLFFVGYIGVHHADADESCTELYTHSTPVLDGFGAAYNTQSSARELLLSGSCAGSQVNATVGSNQPMQYTYHTGYRWENGTWVAVSFAGTVSGTAPDWIEGQGSATFPATVHDDTYFVGYVCQYLGAAGWKCGCTDGACATSAWQLQGLDTHTSPDPEPTPWTQELEAPPGMASNALVVTNVCPGEVGWPSGSQMAGHDVKIILPTDRVCTAMGTLGGTGTNAPAHNIWVVGGEMSYTGTGVNGAALTVRWWDGTAFFEGVKIDMHNTQNDGIRSYLAASDTARIVIQNSYIHGLGYGKDAHGDVFHAQGGLPVVQELVMQNVRGDVINQGLFVPYRTEGHGVRRMTLDHVEFRLDAEHQYSENKISTMIYAGPYGDSTIDLYLPDGQSYSDVYLNWWDPWYPTTTDRIDITLPSPSSYDADGCAVFSSDMVRTAKIEGTWCKGNPTNTYVPLDKIGRNYDRAYFTGN